MAYLARPDAMAKRNDPLTLMSECRSIICLAFPYPNSNQISEVKDLNVGKVASYALIPDYHTVLPSKIDELMGRAAKKSGQLIGYKAFTDSAPILERELAQRAGLGWIGKNSCLINPRHGSFFLLAEVFIDIVLEPDSPLEVDRCGTCSRCISACPTQCIQPDRTIDSRRCISFITIENKGPIPLELRKSVGGWVFGCDICQMVCPWNNMRVGGESEYGVFQAFNDNIDLMEELDLTETEFKAKYAASPILRAKHKGYLRNVTIVAGNNKTERAIQALIKLLSGGNDPVIRGAAAWSLGQIRGRVALHALEQQSRIEKDDQVIEEIRLALETY